MRRACIIARIPASQQCHCISSINPKNSDMKTESQAPRIIEIPKHVDSRGNLSVVDASTCLPFPLKRVFYVYDIPAGCERGGHSHFSLHQFLWCVSGAIEIATITITGEEQCFQLSLPWQGLYIPPLVWAHETAKSAGCTYFVAASAEYDENDYIRSFDHFKSLGTSL